MTKVNLPHYGLYGLASPKSGLHGQPDDFDKDIAVFLNEEKLTVPQFKLLLAQSGLNYSQFKKMVIGLMEEKAALHGLGLFEKKEGGTTVGNWLRNSFGRKDGG